MPTFPDHALGFCGGSLDRAAVFRGDPEWIARKRAEPTAKLLRFNGDKVRIEAGALYYETTIDEEAIFLGIDSNGHAVFTDEAVEPLENAQDLRSLAMEAKLPASDLAALALARSLLHWHQRRRLCSNCGNPLQVKDGGYRRHCPHCSSDHFPRTDPVVIIIVRSGDDVLLGRQTSWPTGRYSALAGFMEPGETIEEAARREVFEETGIRVGAIAYVASQPWPYPSSLMIGLIGEALNRDIVIDEKEIEHARWFSRSEALAMLDERHADALSVPPPMAIAHKILVDALK
ncbi:MAG TPA: NAD(+) diphosphatase [Nordella sp.]|nr:NAD(+) diphosphatase [Nordella sp.]